MEQSTSSALKRKCISPVQEEVAKASKAKRENFREILDLPDCIMLDILKYLDANNLYQLGKTCRRFECLVQDQTLWVDIEGRGDPNTVEKINFCWKNLGSRSRSLKLRGTKRSRVVLNSKILESEYLGSLTVLVLERQCIKYCKFNEFPESLQEVSFKYSYIPKHSTFFRFSEKQMCNLRVLILDYCKWFDANCFISLCKYPKLEILSLYMCMKLTEDEIANVTLAARSGFAALKVVDLRFTGLGDVFIRSFYINPSLQIIYFQCYGTSYAIDRYKRKLDIINGAKMEDYSYVSDDEENCTDNGWIRRRFNARRTQKYETQTIKDNSIAVLKQLVGAETHSTRPVSVLYKYPYNDCTCGYFFQPPNASETELSPQDSQVARVSWNADDIRAKLNAEITKQRENRIEMDGGEIYFMLPNNSLLCNKIVFDSCMIPEWCAAEATLGAPTHKWLFTRTPRNDFEISMFENVDKHYLTLTNYKCHSWKSCDCPHPPLRGNAIKLKTPRPTGEFVEEQRVTYYDGQLLYNPYEDFPLLFSITSFLLNIEHTDDAQIEAMSATYHIVQLILESENLFNHNFLQNKACLREISQFIYLFVMTVEFDIYHVLCYHSSCFDDLCRHIRSDCDISECVKHFFAHLLRSVQIDFSNREDPPDSDHLQFQEEEQEHLEITCAALRNGSNNVEPLDTVQRPPIRRVVVHPYRGEIPYRFHFANAHIDYNSLKKYTTCLKELSFRGYTHITDASLLDLKDLNLNLLDITGTNVTAEGAQQFMAYNPLCRVIHESACVCRPNLHF